MRTFVAPAAALLLAATFAWAGMVKVLGPDRWRRDLLVYRLPRPLRAAGWLLLPWVELTVPVVVMFGLSRLGAGLALGLLCAFSVSIIRARILVGSDQLACGCFGGPATHDYRVLLARNVLLAGLAVYVFAYPASGLVVSSPVAAGLVVGAVGVVAAAWVVRQLLVRRGEASPTAEAT